MPAKRIQVRPNMQRLKGYTPGEQPQDGDVIKLNTNENPYPPPAKVLTGIRKAIQGDLLRRYPDPLAQEARKAVAKGHNLIPDQVLIGHGSDEVLGLIIRAFAGNGGTVLSLSPSYTFYETLAQIHDAEMIWEEFTEDYDLPRGFPNTRADVTIICNPNSPSGTFLDAATIDQMLNQISGILVIDEAYVRFARESMLPLLARHENLILVRTLSKGFSLAGVRTGYALADPHWIDLLSRVKDPYNVDRVGHAALIAAFDNLEAYRPALQKVRRERKRLREALWKLGFFVFPSQSNFLLARRPGEKQEQVYKELKKQGILVRYFSDPRLEDCLRITVGTRTQNSALIKALKAL